MAEERRVSGFVEHWGWIYVVFQMAEFYRCSREDIYKMNIMQFYNDLSFMKDKGRYDLELKMQQLRETHGAI